MTYSISSMPKKITAKDLKVESVGIKISVLFSDLTLPKDPKVRTTKN